MANLVETATWEPTVNEIATTDPVVGGSGGPANVQATQIANRTAYLKAQTDSLAAAKTVAQHEADADPHPQYAKTDLSNASAPSGMLFRKQGTNLEGGELHLERANNSALLFDVAVDLLDSSVRFFENGGSSRGASLDITECQGNSASSLWHSGNIALTGMVVAFAVQAAPAGFLECNGAAISRTSYAALFAAIGTIFGVGDGATTFNLPDIRGGFLRGWDNGRGVDAGRAFGSDQTASALRTHLANTVMQENDMVVNLDAGGSLPGFSGWGASLGYTLGYSDPGLAGSIRPRNVAMAFFIKY